MSKWEMEADNERLRDRLDRRDEDIADLQKTNDALQNDNEVLEQKLAAAEALHEAADIAMRQEQALRIAAEARAAKAEAVREAAEWVANDMRYRAPEQAAGLYRTVWLAHLDAALSAPPAAPSTHADIPGAEMTLSSATYPTDTPNFTFNTSHALRRCEQP